MRSASNSPSHSPERSAVSSNLLVTLILFAAVAACFFPLTESEFLLWDEATLLVQNGAYRTLSAEALTWMFSSFFYGHDQPLAWLSFALDFSIWGLSAPGFRWTSILLHAINALLIYGIASRLLTFAAVGGTKRGVPSARALRLGAAAAALFFAVHPLRAEPVAWLANRNDLLATLFVLLSLGCYLELQRQGSAGRVPRYLLSLLFFALALFSKASVMTFPAVLIIVDAYPLRRIVRGTARSRLVTLFLEKLPYVILSVPFAILAVLAKREEGGLGALASHGWIERTAQAAYGLAFYLQKTLVPSGLSPLYLLGEQIDPTQPRYVLSLIALVGVVVLLILMRRRAPWLVASWACYAALLLPVLGLTQAGAQLVADRYAYLSCVPWAILFGAGVLALASRRVDGANHNTRQYLVIVGLALVVALFGTLCHRQVRFWRDSIQLWTRVLQIEPDSHFAYQNRGRAYQLRGSLDLAIADYDQALALEPTQSLTYRSRGIARRESGDLQGAMDDLEQAAQLNPDSAQAWIDLGVTRRSAGELDRAIADFSRAIELRPSLFRAHQQRGLSFEKAGAARRALADYDQAIRLDPRQYRAYHSRGRVRESVGDLAGAAEDYAIALELAPPNWKVRGDVQRGLERTRTAPDSGGQSSR